MDGIKNRKRRVGIIGNGHLGQFLRHELTKSDRFSVEMVWNRSEDEQDKVLPLTEITEESLKNIDLGRSLSTDRLQICMYPKAIITQSVSVIEVAHPQVVENFAGIILKHADFFVGI